MATVDEIIDILRANLGGMDEATIESDNTYRHAASEILRRLQVTDWAAGEKVGSKMADQQWASICGISGALYNHLRAFYDVEATLGTFPPVAAAPMQASAIIRNIVAMIVLKHAENNREPDRSMTDIVWVLGGLWNSQREDIIERSQAMMHGDARPPVPKEFVTGADDSTVIVPPPPAAEPEEEEDLPI